MPWCPKCRAEYREGFNKCADCKVELVNHLPPEHKHKPHPKFDTEAVLTTVDNEVQASVVEYLLHSFDIPTARNYREAGSYVRVITGTSGFGIDICVPSHKLAEGKEILKSTETDRPHAKRETTHLKEKRGSYEQKRRVAQWIMLIALAIIFAVSILVGVRR